MLHPTCWTTTSPRRTRGQLRAATTSPTPPSDQCMTAKPGKPQSQPNSGSPRTSWTSYPRPRFILPHLASATEFPKRASSHPNTFSHIPSTSQLTANCPRFQAPPAATTRSALPRNATMSNRFSRQEWTRLCDSRANLLLRISTGISRTSSRTSTRWSHNSASRPGVSSTTTSASRRRLTSRPVMSQSKFQCIGSKQRRIKCLENGKKIKLFHSVKKLAIQLRAKVLRKVLIFIII